MLQRLPISPADDGPADDGDDTALTVNVALADGARFAVPAAGGLRLDDVIRSYGFAIQEQPLAGRSGGTCHVRVAEKWRDALPAPTTQERARLATFPAAGDGSRLASELVMTGDLDGIEIEVQPDSLVPQTSWVAG